MNKKTNTNNICSNANYADNRKILLKLRDSGKKITLLTLSAAVVSTAFCGTNADAAWIVGDNIVSSASVSVFPAAGNTNQLKSITDGVIGDGTGDKRWYAGSNQIDAYAEFKYPEKTMIGSVRVVSGQTNSSASAPEMLTSFAIQYLDGDTWKDACVVKDNTEMDLTVRFAKPAESTNFRLKSLQTSSFRLREIELYQAFKISGDMVRAPQIEDSADRVAYEALVNMGIIEERDTYNAESTVTKEEFVHYLLNITNNTGNKAEEYKSSYTDVEESKYKDDIVYAEVLGYIGKDKKDKFNPKSEITYTEAAQMILSAVGYDYFAEDKGGYPNGYIYYASKNNLKSGVNPLKNDYITYGDVVNLLYNATSIPVYEYVNGKNKTSVSTGKSFLEFYFNISKMTGIIYQNESFGIPQKTAEGKVKIGNDIYNVGETDAKDYLGYRMDVWYTEKSGEDTLVYLTPSAVNQVYTIDKKDILKKSDFNQIYYYDENDKEKSKKLDYNTYVFLNGELGAAYVDDLYNGSGSLTLIDNDGDGSINVVLIDSLRHMVAASVSNGIIYDKLGGEAIDTNNALQIDVVRNGVMAMVKDIKEDDVLSVSVADNGEIITIYASDKKVKGTVSKVNRGDEPYVEIDGKEYKFYESLTEDMQVGITAEFCLDKDGVIAYIGDRISLEVKYGLLLGIGGDEWTGVKAKLLTTDDGVKEYMFKDDKITFNDVGTEPIKLIKNNKLYDSDGKVGIQVVKYQLNSDGKISKLYADGVTAPAVEPELLDNNQDGIVRYTDANDYYYLKPILTEYNMGRTMILNENTIVFYGPLAGGDDDEYTVSVGINGLTAGDWRGTTQVYDLSHNSIPGALLFLQNERPAGLDTAKSTSIVAETYEVYNDKTEDKAFAIKMYTAGKEETYIVSDKCKYNLAAVKFLSPFGDDYSETDIKTIKKGDVIQYAVKNNEIIVFRVLAKIDDLMNLKEQGKSTEIQQIGGTSQTLIPALDTMFGSAYSRENNVFVAEIDGKKRPFNCPDTANVYIYDSKRNTLRKGNFGDLVYKKNSSAASQVFVRAYRKTVQDVLVVE